MNNINYIIHLVTIHIQLDKINKIKLKLKYQEIHILILIKCI